MRGSVLVFGVLFMECRAFYQSSSLLGVSNNALESVNAMLGVYSAEMRKLLCNLFIDLLTKLHLCSSRDSIMKSRQDVFPSLDFQLGTCKPRSISFLRF